MVATTADFMPQRCARIAGALYVAIIVLGIGSEAFLRAGFLVPGDPAATAANIVAAETRFRLGVAADLIMAHCDVALAVLLFMLLRPAGSVLAGLATAFRLVQAAVIGANLLNLKAALLLLSGGGAQADAALAATFLELHGNGYDLALAFFGIASLAYGVLVIRSGFLPRAIGVLVFAAGLVYLAGTALVVLAPAAVEVFQYAYALPVVAETAFALWLLLRGVDVEAWRRAQEKAGG